MRSHSKDVLPVRWQRLTFVSIAYTEELQEASERIRLHDPRPPPHRHQHQENICTHGCKEDVPSPPSFAFELVDIFMLICGLYCNRSSTCTSPKPQDKQRKTWNAADEKGADRCRHEVRNE